MTNRRSAFKYRAGDPATVERDLHALEGEYFYAPTRDLLNDPFEGRLDRRPLEAQFDLAKSIVGSRSLDVVGSLAKVSTALEQVFAYVDRSGIFSLSGSALHELLWAHYGGSHKGFCIEYDLDRLVGFDSNAVHCIDVAYTDAIPTVTGSDILSTAEVLPLLQKMLGVKSTAWAYEAEVRVVTSAAGQHQHDFRAVRAIYFGLRCSDELRNRVMRTMAGRGIQYRQVVSAEHSYLLAAEELQDAYRDSPAYRENYAPMDESAISTAGLRPELQALAHYLAKAAEIVRREPYCERIEQVDFSPSKSQPQDPVVFVQYRRGERWVNHYLTLGEIDEQFHLLPHSAKDV